MKLNQLMPAFGSRPSRTRVGRGIGSGLGKTCGRGHKGQTSRTGGKIAPGFEGGQQPLHRRLPKFGFVSLKAKDFEEIRLNELMIINEDVIDLETLRKYDIIKRNTKRVKVILSGSINKSVVLKGIAVTKGAKAAIESSGGKIEE